MPSFASADGVEIAYYSWGERTGRPVVLHHGFISNASTGWKGRGVVDVLTGAGFWAVAIDARGHGESGKPHNPELYGEDKMADDLAQLLDVLGVTSADLVGYSMGAIVCLLLATRDARVRRVVAGGIGGAIAELGTDTPRRIKGRRALADALRADDPESITSLSGAAFRAFADRMGGDRMAFAAQVEAMRIDPIPLSQITAPVLVVGGDADMIATRPEVLADAIPGARCLVLPGDHLQVPGTPAFAAAVTEFLG